jgi:hypothetical protein
VARQAQRAFAQHDAGKVELEAPLLVLRLVRGDEAGGRSFVREAQLRDRAVSGTRVVAADLLEQLF